MLVELTNLYCSHCPNLISIPISMNIIHFEFDNCPWLNSIHNPDYEGNVKKFKEDYDSLFSTSLSPFLVRKIVKFLVPIKIN